MTEIGRWIDRQRRRREWNQSELARRLGLRHGTVSRWLSGAMIPSPEMCDRLADVFGVPVDDVLTLAGHRPAVNDEPDPVVREIITVVRQLPAWHRSEVLEYARARRLRALREVRESDG